MLRTRSVCLFFRHQKTKATIATTSTGTTQIICWETSTKISVGSGSWPPRVANIPLNTGTMKISIAATATRAMMRTMTG